MTPNSLHNFLQSIAIQAVEAQDDKLTPEQILDLLTDIRDDVERAINMVGEEV